MVFFSFGVLPQKKSLAYDTGRALRALSLNRIPDFFFTQSFLISQKLFLGRLLAQSAYVVLDEFFFFSGFYPKKKKKKPGNDLLSHGRTAVPSAQEGLTTVFGMGTGGTPLLWSPDLLILSLHPFASQQTRYSNNLSYSSLFSLTNA